MRGIELLITLQKLNKPFYTISELERITRLPRNSLYVALSRWVGGGILEKVTQGIYVPAGDIRFLVGGSYQPVSVSVIYNFPVLTGLIPGLGNIPLSSTTTMRKEY